MKSRTDDAVTVVVDESRSRGFKPGLIQSKRVRQTLNGCRCCRSRVPYASSLKGDKMCSSEGKRGSLRLGAEEKGALCTSSIGRDFRHISMYLASLEYVMLGCSMFAFILVPQPSSIGNAH